MTRLLWLLAAPLVACTQVGKTFVCSTDAECSIGSVTGTCEVNHYCSIPSTSCATFGRAYDSSAGDGLGGTCVGLIAPPGGPSNCTTFVSSVAKSDCESFEDNTFGKTFGLYNMSGGVLSIGTDHVYRGTGAGHAQAPVATNGPAIAAQLNRPMADESSGSIAMRGFFYADDAPPAGAGLLSLQQDGGAMLQHELILDTDGTIVLFDPISKQRSQRVAMPFGQWVCIELDIQIATEGEMDVYINDVAQPTLSLKADTLVTPYPANLFEAAIYFVAGQTLGAWDMWLDEIAIAPTHIGCAQ